MPTTQPPPPEAEQERAFKLVVDILRGNPMLRARNVSWAYWSDDRDDLGTRNPAEQDCPFIRITPLGSGRAERRGSDGVTTDYLVPMSVQITTMIAGTDRREAFGLGSLILGALFPRDRAERAALDERWRSAGVADVHLRRAILPVEFYQQFIASEGEIELWQFMQL
jgi:hypothetical protein